MDDYAIVAPKRSEVKSFKLDEVAGMPIEICVAAVEADFCVCMKNKA